MVAMAEPWRHPETGTFYLRRQIPKQLREEFGGRQLWKRSLETKDSAEARRIQADTRLLDNGAYIRLDGHVYADKENERADEDEDQVSYVRPGEHEMMPRSADRRKLERSRRSGLRVTVGFEQKKTLRIFRHPVFERAGLTMC
ncbi:DUF6538 domain-containing protein [Sphingomonas sp. PAMC 26605]|uniref:DUF6538 domain-containing protein n=1 Tax=Sphingomonas sp. PAMC 26605 TaxID=1112214 RepID=UPI00026CDC34|nr:DUF6538 domain-containing protein [Sphingomonas sp. PAMC 26605]